MPPARAAPGAPAVQEEIANLSREALAHPEQAQALAWALRRLVQWEPFQKRDGLRTSAQRLIELMVRDHMVDLQNELEQLRASVEACSRNARW